MNDCRAAPDAAQRTEIMTSQKYFDSERMVVSVRSAFISKIREMSKNQKMAEALVAWIMSQPCDPMHAVCGFDMPKTDEELIARVKVVAEAWLQAGKPGLN